MTDGSVVAGADKDRTLLVGGEIRATGDAEPEPFYRRVNAILERFLQVKHLNILVGAGASYDLGSPRIRAMTPAEIAEMAAAGGGLPKQGLGFIERLARGTSGRINLEWLLSLLASGAQLTDGTGEDITLGDVVLSLEHLLATRRVLNHALALECQLPKEGRIEEAELRKDPLRSHRALFRSLLRARRIDLPRIRVFTPNYDQIIEKALDELDVRVIDGFVGSVSRTFRPECFDQDLFVSPPDDARGVVRVEDVIHLYKIHGSINWRYDVKALDEGVVESRDLSPGADELVLIFPTQQKEADALAYPYSVLFRFMSEALNRKDSALLVVGYGFADSHINRLILEALSNPTFQLFIVNPAGGLILDESSKEARFSETPLGLFASAADRRISFLTGDTAGRLDDFAINSLPGQSELDEAEATAATRLHLADALNPARDDA